MNPNSLAELKSLIAEKTQQIDQITQSAEIEWKQILNSFQQRLEDDLSKQLQDVVSTTSVTIKQELQTFNQSVSQTMVQQKSQTELLLSQTQNQLKMIKQWGLIILALVIVASLMIPIVVWIATPKGLEMEQSVTQRGSDGTNWVYLTNPDWVTCKMPSGNSTPCRIIKN